MLDLLYSEDFADYRRAEMAMGARIVSGLLTREVSPEYLKGALDMLRMITCLPLDHAKTEEAKETMKALIARDLGIVEMGVLRGQMERG